MSRTTLERVRATCPSASRRSSRNSVRGPCSPACRHWMSSSPDSRPCRGVGPSAPGPSQATTRRNPRRRDIAGASLAASPDGTPQPAVGEAHGRLWDLRIVGEERSKPMRPLTLRSDVVKEILEDGQDAEKPVVRHLHWVMPAGILIGNLRLEAKLPVPEATVMGTRVSHAVQSAKPRQEHLTRYPESPRDVLLDRLWAPSEQGEQHSERHQFGDHPVGRTIMVGAILLAEVLDERLTTASAFRIELVDEVPVRLGRQIRQVGRVTVAERTLGVGQGVDQLGADTDLDALNGVEHEQPELTVEGVAAPDDLERSPFNKGVVRQAKGIPVAAEAVVADTAQSGQELIAIGHKTASEKLVGLLVNGEGALRVLHELTPGKKNPPEVSMLGRGLAGVL